LFSPLTLVTCPSAAEEAQNAIKCCSNQSKTNTGADMAHRGRRSGKPDTEPFQGYVLTPQAFTTSNLALGPVLHYSGADSLIKRFEKAIENLGR